MRVSTTRHRGAKAIDIGSWITLRWQWSVDDIARVAIACGGPKRARAPSMPNIAR